MPSRAGSSTTASNSRIRVVLTTKLAYRFYAPIILLKALNSTCTKKPLMTPDPLPDMTQSLEHIFQCFVNTLAQLCDTEKGGDTVTAFVVLQYPDHIEYRFASNQRDTRDLVLAQDFTSYILKTLKNIQEDGNNSVISKILQRSLSFGRSRVMMEVKTLQDRAEECMNACKIENTNESDSILKKLEELYEELLVSNIVGLSGDLSDDEFAKKSEILIHHIHDLRQSEVHELISNRTKEGQIDESEKWSEFRHVAGRLSSYLRAAKTLVFITKRWPELFDEPEVYYISSSVPDVSPFRGKRSVDKVTAHEVIGYMTSNSNKQEEYRTYAEELQKIKLDQAMQRHAHRQTIRPIVHAEVLLLEWLENNGGTRPFRFFKGYKYIGCSKPSCILCYYYFLRHSSRVKVRPTHRNLYPSWRMPDVYEDQGPDVEKEKMELMLEVLSLIKKDAFRTLKEKLGDGRLHDSNTSSWYPKDSASVGSRSAMEDMTSSFKNLQVQRPDYADKLSTITEISSLNEDEDEDYYSC